MNLQDLFSTVCNMSLTGSFVIGFVLLARLLLRKAPKVFSYALWAVVLFRLLCPVSISSALSLLNFTRATVAESEGLVTSVEYTPALDIYQYGQDLADTEVEEPEVQSNQVNVQMITSIPENRPEIPQTPDAESQQATAEPVREPIYYAAYIWLVGIGVMLVYNIICYWNLRRKLIGAVCLRKNIYLADHIPSPFVMGLFRPRIYLPSVLARSERRYILAHERYHIRRKDHIVKLLAYGALCLHWFNPLVWIAFTLSGKDMEMSCDEAVISRYGPVIRADYSASLLRLATQKRIIAATPLAFGEGDTKGRVLNMAKWKKPKIWVMVCAAILCIGVLAACAMNPSTQNTESTEQTLPPDTTAPLWITEVEPEEACRRVIEELKNADSYYILYEYSTGGMTGMTEYRRHGNDLLIGYVPDAAIASSIYFDGVYGMYYGDYWVWDRGTTNYDPNEWLDRWSVEEKQVSNIRLEGNTIVFDAVWPHQMNPEKEYRGTFTYTFLPDGALATIEREYIMTGGEEESDTTTDKLTILEEAPADTYAAIKAIADQCIEEEELEDYRRSEDVVTEVPSNNRSYDQDFALGAGQMRWWFLDSSWQFALGAENATPTSATLVHSESGADHQSLKADAGFWLEQLVDGKWCYVNESITNAEAQEMLVDVSWTTTDSYQLDWSDSYGALNPGYYRIGRNYTVTMSSGETDTTVCYAKFRIFDENFDDLLETCRNAFDTLLTGQSYHVQITEYNTDYIDEANNTFNLRIENIWKNGRDYLEESSMYYREDSDTPDRRSGYMMRGDGKYTLTWAGDSILSPLASWRVSDYLDETNFTLWTSSLEWYDSRVEDVIQNGNQISIIKKYDFDDKYENSEITLTFDDAGNITAMTKAYLPTRNCAEADKVIDVEMVVLDTSAGEIAQTIGSQDVSKPVAFSYEEDIADHPGAVTDGFVNTTATTIRTMDDVVALAAKECTLPPNEALGGGQYNIYTVSYDESAKMWKVEFWFSQNFDHQAIYLDANGITCMAVTWYVYP